MKSSPDTNPVDYRTLAAFRRSLRQFLHFSAKAARGVGLTPQHYQALLALKATDATQPFIIGQLADELLLRHHSAVELVDRLAARGLVERVEGGKDGRRVGIKLTPAGDAMIARLARTHRAELRRIGPEIRRVLGIISASGEKPPRGK